MENDLRSAAASLSSNNAKVEALSAEIIEYLDIADYSKYFDQFSYTPENGGQLTKFVEDALKVNTIL